jgi:GDP-4-dehydro-6-deoxy-D-mannose reductase
MPAYLSVQAFINQLVAFRMSGQAKVLKVGNLQTSRDYLHVQTVVEAYWRLIRTEAAFGLVVNVCSGTPTRIADIVAMLLDINGDSVRVEVDPNRVKSIDIAVHYGDNRLLRKLTGMVPEMDLRAALEEAFHHAVSKGRA